MGEQEIKVFELAKELEIPSIDLVGKLKGLKIDVKSHMSTLTASQVETARNSLGPKKPKTAAGRSRTKSKSKSPVLRRRQGQSEEVTTAKPKKSSVVRKRAASKTEDSTEEAPVTKTAAPQEEAEDTTVVKTKKTKKKATVTKADAQVEEPKKSETTPPDDTHSETTTPAKPAPPKSFLKVSKAAKKPLPKPRPKPKAPDEPQTPPDEQKRAPNRIIKMTKENIDRLAEEEAAKKRGGGGGGGRDQMRPEDRNFADYYHKKELFFMPKRKRVPVGRSMNRTEKTERKASKRVLDIHDSISIQEFSQKLGIKANEVIKKLMGMGQMASINHRIDFDTATLIANEYQWEVKNIAFKEDDVIIEAKDDEASLKSRPPVVTIMGHVDHGKTSLLDAIRETKVADKEAGGITQHVGAYTVEKNGKLITFIDTPGHEAFTNIRARGANTTDIVVLVVAADDGVMPQTREAVSHAKAAKVPIVVAVNKMDVPGANPEKIKQALSELDLLAEDWGGETLYIMVSAKEKTNLDKLLDAILLNADLLELKANPDAEADGTVLEAKLEKGKGPVVDLLVKRGTLKRGDCIVAGTHSGKVRAMIDDSGKQVQKVTPGMAAAILGLEGVPNAGDPFNAVESESAAKKVAQHREEQIRAQQSGSKKVSLEELFSSVQQGDLKDLNIVLKADVFGSLEAVKDSLTKLPSDKVKVNIIHSSTGGISESDVLLASASGAIIIGFNIRPENKARQIASSKHIEIKTYSIIYELIDDIKAAMTGMLDKKAVEKFQGRAEVRQTFSVPKIGVIAGSAVVDGKITRHSHVRLLRENRIVFEGKLSSLKRFKDDAKEVQNGYECGIGIENYNDIKTGDVIEAFEIEQVAQEL